MAQQQPTSQAWRDKIRVLLRGRDLTQRKLARAIGASDSVVAKWLSGDAGISFQSAQRVATALGVSVSDLLSDAPLSADLIQSFFSDGTAKPPTFTKGVSSSMEERRQRLHALIDAVEDEGLEEAAQVAASWLAEWHGRRMRSGSEANMRRELQR